MKTKAETEPDEKWTLRYRIYAMHFMLTPEQCLEADKRRWPGGCMTGYTLWIQNSLAKFKKLSPEKFSNGVLIDNDEFETFLDTTPPPDAV